MKNKIFYTGIGSRKLPPDIYKKFVEIGEFLAHMGLVLRSGAAHGADAAFEIGCDKKGGDKEIYLPCRGFNNHPSNLFYLSPEATELAEEHYGSAWRFVSPATRSFMTRNMYQVTGLNLDVPSKFIVCWTLDGVTTRSERTKETGGTGQAIAYGSSLNIPIFNFGKEGDEERFLTFLENELNE